MWDHLTDKIKAAYESTVSLPEAEKLAAEFLHAQLIISNELAKQDLDARMRKTGVKAMRSAVRVEEIKKHDKKPTEGALEDVVNLDDRVQSEQGMLDDSESQRDHLERLYNIFRESHLYFRGIAKGSFSG